MTDLAKKIAEGLRQEQMTHQAVTPRGPSERGRAIAQGITFGGADEAEAFLRSSLGGEDYDTALADVRGKLKAYKGAKPWEALAYEAGGAALPAIVGSIFTGGGSTAAAGARFFPTLAKMSGIGMTEGGLYALGTGEGGAWNRAARVPAGMVAGGIGGGVGYSATRGLAGAGGNLLDYVKRTLGDRASKRVERELMKAVEDSGLTMDEVLARVERGELLPEMSKTLRSVARGYYARSREAAGILEGVYNTRPDALRKETMDYLQTNMSDTSDNVLKQVRQGEDAMQAAASKEYNSVFQNAGPLNADAVDALKTSLARVPESGDDVKRIYRAQTGKEPFFTIKGGDVTFNRTPTLEDAEIVRRGIDSATSRQFRSGSGGVGSAYRNVERGLRTQIDNASGGLKDVRAKWSNLERAKDAFEKGRKALTKSPDEVEILFEEASEGGDVMVKAFRAGVADAFRRKASTGSRKSIPRNIDSEEAREGAVLRIVFPEDQLGTMLGKAKLATGAQSAANDILGGSQTAVTQGRSREMGGTLADAVEAGAGNSFALIRLGADAIKALQPTLSERDVARLAQLMVEENPAVLRRALTDTTALAQVSTYARDMLRRASQPAGAIAGGSAEPTRQGAWSQIAR